MKSYKYGSSHCLPCLYRWHKKLCCISNCKKREAQSRTKVEAAYLQHLAAGNTTAKQQCDLTSPSSFNLEETLYPPQPKTSHERFSISWVWNMSSEMRGQLTSDGVRFRNSRWILFFMSILDPRARDMIHTFNNYCKCNYHLQNRLLLFIQTWSARWAGARLRIVVTADQSQQPNKEGTDLQTRRPMNPPL